MAPSAKDIDECVRVLEELVLDRAGLAEASVETQTRLMMAAGRVSRPERTEQRVLSRAMKKKKKLRVRTADEAVLSQAGIRKKRQAPVFVTPEPSLLAAPAVPEEAASLLSAELNRTRICYVCKGEVTRVHFFYDQMCSACGRFNYEKRSQTADLSGRVALITGARVKIGYQAAIMLLRAGARVLVTTRFARDAARRYAREPDFLAFRERLRIYPLDLRHTPSVEAFAQELAKTESQLDYVLHNACQTVRRPAGFYRELAEDELAGHELPPHVQGLLATPEHALQTSSAAARLPAPAALSQVPLTPEDLEVGHRLFPTGQLDADLQQIDLRELNSWRLSLDQVGTVELLEVQLVNAIAPFVLNARLRSLMQRTPTRDKHIVNVSAMEGKFYRRFKTDKHPHTNMAKAALNMMTRTSASDYVKDGIHMNSVDTGWVTDEDPAHIARRKTEENGFHPPLDIVDGAARIVDPIFDGVNSGTHIWGQFLKDYRPTAW